MQKRFDLVISRVSERDVANSSGLCGGTKECVPFLPPQSFAAASGSQPDRPVSKWKVRRAIRSSNQELAAHLLTQLLYEPFIPIAFHAAQLVVVMEGVEQRIGRGTPSRRNEEGDAVGPSATCHGNSQPPPVRHSPMLSNLSFKIFDASQRHFAGTRFSESPSYVTIVQTRGERDRLRSTEPLFRMTFPFDTISQHNIEDLHLAHVRQGNVPRSALPAETLIHERFASRPSVDPRRLASSLRELDEILAAKRVRSTAIFTGRDRPRCCGFLRSLAKSSCRIPKESARSSIECRDRSSRFADGSRFPPTDARISSAFAKSLASR